MRGVSHGWRVTTPGPKVSTACEAVDICVAKAALNADAVAAADAVDAKIKVACTITSKTTSTAVAAAVDAAAGAAPSGAAGKSALGVSRNVAGDEAVGYNEARPGLTSLEGDRGEEH